MFAVCHVTSNPRRAWRVSLGTARVEVEPVGRLKFLKNCCPKCKMNPRANRYTWSDGAPKMTEHKLGPICSMYGIFTYIYHMICGKCMVNIPYMERMPTGPMKNINTCDTLGNCGERWPLMWVSYIRKHTLMPDFTPLKINGWNMSKNGGGWFRSCSFPNRWFVGSIR